MIDFSGLPRYDAPDGWMCGKIPLLLHELANQNQGPTAKRDDKRVADG
jgi:hypothetical protein